MSLSQQDELLFADGSAPELHPPDPRAGFYREVTDIWQLPLGERVRVLLRGHDLAEAVGRLELERAPDLPLNGRVPLHLTAGGVSFLSTQVESWSLLG
ncbi:MAG: hypothetical protein HYV75_01625 [Opitutae bacterium]|nr:hypothetical protein [Opitutae bacterium]